MNHSKKQTLQPTASDDLRLRSFDRSLPMTLLRAREAVMKTFIPSLQAHGLSPQQWRTLRALMQENGLEISILSSRCHLLAPSMSRIIQNLESRNLIKLRNVSTDQRRKSVFITTKGIELFNLIAPESAKRYDYITEQFGKEKLELLYSLLHDLVNSIDEPKPKP